MKCHSSWLRARRKTLTKIECPRFQVTASTFTTRPSLVSDSLVASGSRHTGSIAWLTCRAETTTFLSDGEGLWDKFRPVVLHLAPLITTHHGPLSSPWIHPLQLQPTFAHTAITEMGLTHKSPIVTLKWPNPRHVLR